MADQEKQTAEPRPTKPAMTDPARELVDALSLLLANDPTPGDAFLGSRFEVNAWSSEFYQIMFHLLERLTEVSGLVYELGLDEDEADHTSNLIQELRTAFGPSALTNGWQHVGNTALSENRIQALRGVSYLLRNTHAYPKLSDGEVAEVQILIAELLTWLMAHQLTEHDFIRAALIDGLKAFRFRLSKIGWFGWAYTVESLRTVIGAYLALERADVQGDGNYEAMLKHCIGGLRAIFEKLRTVKHVADVGQFMLAAYGGVTLVTGAAAPVVAGLLPHLP